VNGGEEQEVVNVSEAAEDQYGHLFATWFQLEVPRLQLQVE
jgi:hypothetical protein